jgi:carbonic anhydrase/acetyltransferase-like protein (isoleucine patch superfamily)
VNPDRTLDGDWFPGAVPKNVFVDPEAYLETTYSFQLFHSTQPEAVRIGRGASIYLGVMFDLGRQARVAIGAFTLMNGSRIICDSKVEIGDYCLISWNTVLVDNWRLPARASARRRALQELAERSPRRIQAEQPAAPISIANNVWIGFDSCVFPGVSIGEGSIVGARSVVVQDVPPFTVVAGNPARVIRQLDRPPAPSPAAHPSAP